MWERSFGGKPLFKRARSFLALAARAQTRFPARPRRSGSRPVSPLPSPPPTRRSRARSVSIIECGPVRTAFQEKLEGGALDATDPETRDLFRRYQRHCERIYREAAQDPEEVTEVGAARGSGSGGGRRVPVPGPCQRASSRRRRSSSPRCAPRSPPCATSAQSASCPWRVYASTTPAAAATSPPCTAQCSTTRPLRVQRAPLRRLELKSSGVPSSVLLLPPLGKGLLGSLQCPALSFAPLGVCDSEG